MARKIGSRDKQKRKTRRNIIIGGTLGAASLIGLGGAAYVNQYVNPKKHKVKAKPTTVNEAKQNIKDIYEDATVDRKFGRAVGAVDFEVKRGYVEGFIGRAAQAAKDEFPHVVQIPVQMGRESRRKTDRFFEERVINGAAMRGKIKDRIAKGLTKDRIARKQFIRDVGLLGRRIVKGAKL